MTTPHIAAEPGDFASTVLLPGDPLRAEYIADRFLDEARQVTAVRNMYGYTGSYQGIPVSVMGTGMGIPSCSIYTTELVTQFGVSNLIRVGSCGGVHPDLGLRDVVIAMGASTDSNVNRRRCLGLDFAALADFGLLRAAVTAAEAKELTVHVGNMFSSDLFYPPFEGDPLFETLAGLGVLAVEMEAAGIYGVAAQYGAKALAVCTVSDVLGRDEHMTPEERQSSLDDMIEVALSTAVRAAATP